MPALTMAELMEKVREHRVVYTLSRRDVALAVLALMNVWAERFPDESLPLEMNRAFRDLGKQGQ